MPMRFEIKQGTNRAKCKMCGKPITEDMMQITALSGYGSNTSTGSIHADTELCKSLKDTKERYTENNIDIHERTIQLLAQMQTTTTPDEKDKIATELGMIGLISRQGLGRNFNHRR
jgi:hypothetical protein